MIGLPKRRRIRLSPEVYAQAGLICSITIAIRNREPVFTDDVLAKATLEVVRERVLKTGVPVYAFCIKPDHVHLVMGPSESCDVMTFVGQFKNLVQRASWRLGWKGSSWQKSFGDHLLRKDEYLAVVIEYVLSNPVRKGLVESWEKYPFAGSLCLDPYDDSGVRRGG